MTNILYPGFYKVDETGILYTFSGYAGYMILGWYLRVYPLWFVGKKSGWIYSASLLAVIVAIIALIGLYAPEYRCYVMDNLSFGNMLYVVALFSLMQSIFQNESFITKVAKKLTNYTFGIYLIHTFVIHAVYVVLPKESYAVVVQLPVTAMLSFVISLCIVWLLSTIKPLKWSVQGFSVDRE